MSSRTAESIGSVEKAFMVLGAFNSGVAEMRLDDLTNVTGLNKSAVQRVTHTLTHLGYLRKDRRGLYSLTHKVLQMSYAHMRFSSLLQVAAPMISDLADQLQVRADLAVLDDTEVVYLIRIPSRVEMFSISPVGRRWTAISSAPGRAILSCLDDNVIAEIIARSQPAAATPQTITDKARIRDIILAVRKEGYTWQMGEVLVGAAAIAAPVTGLSGEPIGAVSLGTTVTEMQSEPRRSELAMRVMETAGTLSQMNLSHP